MWWRKQPSGFRSALDGTIIRFERAKIWWIRSQGETLGLAPNAKEAEALVAKLIDERDEELFSAALEFVKEHPDKSHEQLLILATMHDVHPNAIREVLKSGRP